MRISDWSSDVCSSDLQGVLPSNQALADGDLEEERRLGYVAITRARRKLAISRAAQRFNKDTLPSVFLCDLEMIERPNYPTDIDLGDLDRKSTRLNSSH